MTAALAVVKRGVRIHCCRRLNCVGTPLHVNIHHRVAESILLIFSLELCLVVGDDGDFLRYVQMKCFESSFKSYGEVVHCVLT
jgi:hypothetical protein